tara:strand:- start:537 stop:731 length:195 start_codon:yes stop_codon:yes gene_type:complete
MRQNKLEKKKSKLLKKKCKLIERFKNGPPDTWEIVIGVIIGLLLGIIIFIIINRTSDKCFKLIQ